MKTNVRWSKDSTAGAKKTDLPLFLMVECSAGPCRHLVILPMYHKRSSSTFAIDTLEKEKMLFRTSVFSSVLSVYMPSIYHFCCWWWLILRPNTSHSLDLPPIFVFVGVEAVVARSEITDHIKVCCDGSERFATYLFIGTIHRYIRAIGTYTYVPIRNSIFCYKARGLQQSCFAPQNRAHTNFRRTKTPSKSGGP